MLRRSVAAYAAGTPVAVRWALAIGFAGLLWFVSSRPGGTGPASTWWSLFWNSGHVVAYFGLAVLVGAARLRGPVQLRRDAILTVVVALGYGIVDELHQSTVPGRHCSILDVVNDGIGATLGAWLGFVHERRVRVPG